MEGYGPEDLQQIVIECAASLLVQTKRCATLEVARMEALRCLASGAPRKKWNEMLQAQGADLDAFARKLALDGSAPVVHEIAVQEEGFISDCDALIIGEAVRDLGAGRAHKEAAVLPGVGIGRAHV
mgnify:CR=1 FL=1